MARTMTGSGITLGGGTQTSASLRYKGTTTAASSTVTGLGAATDYITIPSTYSGSATGQGIAVVGFDYWKTFNVLDGYGNVSTYWDQVRLSLLRVERRYNYGNFAMALLTHDYYGGAHSFTIKYYAME